MMGSVLWVAPLTVTGLRGALLQNAPLLLKDRWGRGYLHEPITTYFAVQDCTCVATSNNTINLLKLVAGKNKTSAG